WDIGPSPRRGTTSPGTGHLVTAGPLVLPEVTGGPDRRPRCRPMLGVQHRARSPRAPSVLAHRAERWSARARRDRGARPSHRVGPPRTVGARHATLARRAAGRPPGRPRRRLPTAFRAGPDGPGAG